MVPHNSKTSEDDVWHQVRDEAEQIAGEEPLLAAVVHATVLSHTSLESALAFHLAGKLASPQMPETLLRDLIAKAFDEDKELSTALRNDLIAFRDRDPASTGFFTPLMYYKGFHALQSYRVAHWLWNSSRRQLAYYLQNRISELFAVDIHPAAKLGSGIFVDHGTGIVIGETAVVEDNVSMLQEVTLGGTGRLEGDRHPKVHKGVLIGAGAKILGNVIIGENAKVGAGSVVLADVPPKTTVAGVPAVVVGKSKHAEPARGMDHGWPGCG